MSDMMSQGFSGAFSAALIIPILIIFIMFMVLLFFTPISLGVYLFGDYKEQKRAQQYAFLPKVLIVDDDESSILSLQTILESKHASVKLVTSGDEMMQELIGDEYDVVFVDREMPNLNGVDALKVSDNKLSLNRKIPVVFFTGVEQTFEVPSVSQFSVLDVWGKRLSYKKLEEKVGLLLRNIQKGGNSIVYN